jgi:hypothetical protein
MWRWCEQSPGTSPAATESAGKPITGIGAGDQMGLSAESRRQLTLISTEYAHDGHKGFTGGGFDVKCSPEPKEQSMDIHQCPFCELRFISSSEVEWHLLDDHGSRTLATPSADMQPPSTRTQAQAHGS